MRLVENDDVRSGTVTAGEGLNARHLDWGVCIDALVVTTHDAHAGDAATRESANGLVDELAEMNHEEHTIAERERGTHELCRG